MANELKLEQVITNVMINHIGEEGRHIGEGGCPRIQWYALRNELIKAITAWNTRPAAPVAGLERYDISMFGNGAVEMGGGEYVLFSQADAIIAAERAKVQHWQEQYTEMHSQFIDLAKSAEADNAALTARVKELEKDFYDADKSDISARDLLNDQDEKIEALETKLAAAKKALEDIANYPHDETHHCLDIARAALEGRP